jgi:hypothetical protein
MLHRLGLQQHQARVDGAHRRFGAASQLAAACRELKTMAAAKLP